MISKKEEEIRLAEEKQQNHANEKSNNITWQKMTTRLKEILPNIDYNGNDIDSKNTDSTEYKNPKLKTKEIFRSKLKRHTVLDMKNCNE